MNDGFIGEIRMFGGNFAPRSWAFCDGQLLKISSNDALFSILGTTYGGDGRTTFGLPELRGRVPLQQGHGPGLHTRSLGQKSGSYETTLQPIHLPVHNHDLNIKVADGKGDSFGANGNYIAQKAVDIDNNDTIEMYKLAGDATFGNNATLNGLELQRTGSQQPFNNMPPYLTVNYIICVYGTYPSRS